VAVQWLRAHAEELCVDTERIAAVGYSFGAITSLSLAYSLGELAQGDDLTIDELDGSGTVGPGPPAPPPELASFSNEIMAVVSFAGFAIADTIEPGEPPALLIHGRDDRTIPFALAEQTCAAATQVGITCELVAHDSGHGMADDVPGALTLADEFVRREMGIGWRSRRRSTREAFRPAGAARPTCAPAQPAPE
jgi:acetyl esterase/lipase